MSPEDFSIVIKLICALLAGIGITVLINEINDNDKHKLI